MVSFPYTCVANMKLAILSVNKDVKQLKLSSAAEGEYKFMQYFVKLFSSKYLS